MPLNKRVHNDQRKIKTIKITGGDGRFKNNVKVQLAGIKVLSSGVDAEYSRIENKLIHMKLVLVE